MGSQEKLQTGTVVSTKMDKTVVVRIDRYKRHRLYGKTLRVTQRYKAHDERNECNLGDVVRIAETRPLSREKRWRVVDIVQKGDVAEIAPREIGEHILEEARAAAEAEAAEQRAAQPEAPAEAEAPEAAPEAPGAVAEEQPEAAEAEAPAPPAEDLTETAEEPPAEAEEESGEEKES